MPRKGYFTGTVNYGIQHCDTDVLVLNQDIELHGTAWLDVILKNRGQYALIGERIKGIHPAWGGYIHGTFMFARRDAIKAVGLMDAETYPLWGSTCEWQVRFRRKGYQALMLSAVPGMAHERQRGERFGKAITAVLGKEPGERSKFIQTPPMISVIVPCYNYGRFLLDLINSMIGGKTSLGEMPGQTFQSFEIVIVDDGSTDNTPQIVAGLVDQSKGIRSVRNPKRLGTAEANNVGIRNSYGRYITILGSDDMMEPARLEKLVKAAWKHPHSMVYDNVMPFTAGARLPQKNYRVSKYDFERLLERNHVHCGILFPRQAWDETGGYPKAFANGREDWAFNVALGRAGYCGVFIDEPMYLYRREGHNRSLRNASKRPEFLEMMTETFPDLYAGVRPDMCCGSARSKVTKLSPPTNGGGAAAEAMKIMTPGQEGMVLIQYTGSSDGAQSWYGAATGTRYEFGKSRPVGYVDKRDLNTGKANTPGFLEVRGKPRSKDEGKPLFRLYRAPVAAHPVPIKPVQPEPELPELDDAEPVELNGDDLTVISGIGEKTAAALLDLGLSTYEAIAGATDEDLKEAGIRQVNKVRESARSLATSGVL